MSDRITKRNFFVARLFSFKYALNGFISMIKDEPNFRIQLCALVIIVGFGIYFNISEIEWILISLVSGFVITAEILNSAVERIADFISPEYNKAIGTIKDICAAAVLVAASVSVSTGLIIFIPKLQEVF